MTDEERTGEISKEIEATGTEEDFGFGNELFKDLKRRRTTGNYIGNLLPIRLLTKQSTLAYGTLSALNDNKDDFLKLKAADLHLRAKELALFARSFLKELNLKDDRSFAKTTIARMNFAFTFTAAVADIRKAIAFAIKTSRPFAKAKAYASFSELHDHTCFYNTLKADSDLDEEYECFI
ncbi:hypothetical protein MBM_05222 [Drepanopeziza brunnea f. sp. 'multigermtubi' MB_m1]|uniref:Uncharacterized protein n=1 Tax=Marssonina brunnea f. sp. multigermtubi (strain MB_m1) TaxID=1072389 RepID=K1X7Y0_MARBU|nr:uncharacterized protein MBM_05222 [Drepanopeziza brunnea f. sp. 'multigermtubi' MB_m1]EKD16753.1 hypothetical protein MBM_05222 [Drepanopeziza brunnea f. sp. 'multigermtubi' MB_m1]